MLFCSHPCKIEVMVSPPQHKLSFSVNRVSALLITVLHYTFCLYLSSEIISWFFVRERMLVMPANVTLGSSESLMRMTQTCEYSRLSSGNVSSKPKKNGTNSISFWNGLSMTKVFVVGVTDIRNPNVPCLDLSADADVQKSGESHHWSALKVQYYPLISDSISGPGDPQKHLWNPKHNLDHELWDTCAMGG